MKFPKTKKKTSDRKRLVKKLDKVFSQYIRFRDQRCVTCGSRENLQCGHLFSRTAYSTRWHPRNAFCQCSSCNLRHEHDPYPLVLASLGAIGILLLLKEQQPAQWHVVQVLVAQTIPQLSSRTQHLISKLAS